MAPGAASWAPQSWLVLPWACGVSGGTCMAALVPRSHLLPGPPAVTPLVVPRVVSRRLPHVLSTWVPACPRVQPKRLCSRCLGCGEVRPQLAGGGGGGLAVCAQACVGCALPARVGLRGRRSGRGVVWLERSSQSGRRVSGGIVVLLTLSKQPGFLWRASHTDRVSAFQGGVGRLQSPPLGPPLGPAHCAEIRVREASAWAPRDTSRPRSSAGAWHVPCGCLRGPGPVFLWTPPGPPRSA